MKAADRAAKQAAKRHQVDERGRRKNAAKRARKLMEKKSQSMPVVAAPDGPRLTRVVDAELVNPAPAGGLAEVFRQRYLLRLIVGRQLAAQYAASLLGLLWSYIQPALRFVVYYFIFGFVLSSHAGTPNFALRLFTGMVFVHYFTETWTGGTRSVWQNRTLVMKMRVPREIFPVAAMGVAMIHTGPQVLILLIACAFLGWHFSLTAIAAGLLGLAILVTFAMAMALIFSALNVFYKDFQNIVTTVTQFLHFMVPMMYPFSLIYKMNENHAIIYQIYMGNPLAEAVVLMQRLFWYPTIGDPSKYPMEMPPDLWERGFIALGACLVLLYFAQRFFGRLESKFPERL